MKATLAHIEGATVHHIGSEVPVQAVELMKQALITAGDYSLPRETMRGFLFDETKRHCNLPCLEIVGNGSLARGDRFIPKDWIATNDGNLSLFISHDVETLSGLDSIGLRADRGSLKWGSVKVQFAVAKDHFKRKIHVGLHFHTMDDVKHYIQCSCGEQVKRSFGVAKKPTGKSGTLILPISQYVEAEFMFGENALLQHGYSGSQSVKAGHPQSPWGFGSGGKSSRFQPD